MSEWLLQQTGRRIVSFKNNIQDGQNKIKFLNSLKRKVMVLNIPQTPNN